MKRALIALSLALALGPSAAGERPGVDALFASMAITVPAGQERQFVMGDNLSGYYEGYTHSYDKGAGYVLREGTWLRNYATYVGDKTVDRTQGKENVFPYGHAISHVGGVREELAMLSGHQALAMRVSAGKNAARLAIQPLLTEAARLAAKPERQVDYQALTSFVLALDGGTMFMALAASEPFIVEDALLLRSVDPTNSFTVVAAFAKSAEAAQQKAKALAGNDPIAAERFRLHAELTSSYLHTSDIAYNKALNWSKAASRLFVVEEFGTGIWAGLPWFRDNWGRDTFIALPGTLLVSGQFDKARQVLANFARYQNLKRDKEYGRIPNRVSSTDGIIYNTVDGTPWMLREAMEYIRYSGDKAFAREMYQLATPYFEGAAANFMDSDSLLTHDDADTWMDARIEGKQPWSARGPRAVEIQALWYTALQTGVWLAQEAGDAERAARWSGIASQARGSFKRLFWDGKVMADRLRADATRDTKVRPNQLMLVSIPFDDFIDPLTQANVTRNAVSQLLYPYGIASLSQDDPYFHPRHENPGFHHKDAAYHQGTVWGWNAGFTITALNKFGYQDLSWRLSRNLGQQILGLGTLGNMSELLDALPPLKPSGTYAQSWSVAEFARNAYQDFVGFRPNLPDNTLAFVPAIPAAWKHFDAVLPFGRNESLSVAYRAKSGKLWTFKLQGTQPRTIQIDWQRPDGSRMRSAFEVSPGQTRKLQIALSGASLDGKPLAGRLVLSSYRSAIGPLDFVKPKRYRPQDFPVLRGKDILKGIVEREEYR
jgi:glycogen debranching enzyme